MPCWGWFSQSIITNKLSTSHSYLGYRPLSEFNNIKYNWTVSKEQVGKCPKVVDPEGLKERWRKVKRHRIYKTNGPGDVFHMDGNDKLNDGGFASSLDQLSQKERVISLHKTSFANEEIPNPKICRNGEILRIKDFRGKKTRPRILPRKTRPHVSNWFFWF